MEISTIAGIVIAVIIIIFGLFLVFRKPKEYVPSLETELHINPETNQPVIPRFVRDQLAQITPAAEPSVANNVANDEKPAEALAQPEIAAEIASPTAENQAQAEQVKDHTEIAASAATDTQAIETVATPTAEALPEQAKEDEQPRLDLSLNADMQTAEVAAFEEESSILDLHLHEQQCYDDESALSKAEHIIALNVFPNPRKVLSGDKALKTLLKYGLRFGELSCFHRYEDINEPSPLMFSVLRMTDEGPSGFDLESLSAEQIQGFSFFLALPNAHAQTGFDMMVSIAGLIARDVDGKVFDENNCELTQQLKEHWRHQVIDYKPQATPA
ncbi:cell division protein ZipA C-terminal FtsZ-binding domain-containing protein [Acinetobacter sp. MD2(2019)]|uniref:cell division protein ZipA C-terminal FtsZ-binding domain-containing protein n=1 Tax=Acinetobacter sp. MD2(2019) TaxID=2605273 RepID=UPI002D1E999C|nr:cell division protein ZipA C-terminal FtsZ-binding domain-containing protein [Acinetobacter sp. MD2(2019)]MEB3753959.1 cell division protein ZipA [Acinetobacter sp. MD2(2019)]